MQEMSSQSYTTKLQSLEASALEIELVIDRTGNLHIWTWREPLV